MCMVPEPGSPQDDELTEVVKGLCAQGRPLPGSEQFAGSALAIGATPPAGQMPIGQGSTAASSKGCSGCGRCARSSMTATTGDG